MQPCPRPSINYHHHLFYIREPFVTKKGILTVCLMGETFKLEQTHIYHTTQLTVLLPGQSNLTNLEYFSFIF